MRLFSFASIDMLDYTFGLGDPIASQSGTLLAPVNGVNLGCETGNSHTLKTIVQSGTGRKSKKSKTKRARKHKKVSKSGKRKYKRTMNRRRKRSHTSRTGKKSKRSHKSTRKMRRTRVNQVGRGSSYENVLTPIPNMGPQGAARSDVALVHTGPV